MEFEKGYLFGKVLGADKYILMECQPNENDNYGIINYQHGNADFIRLTQEQLDALNSGDDQWIDHNNMISYGEHYFIADTVGEAIIGFEEKSGTTPELYLRTKVGKTKTLGSAQFQRIDNMTADEINDTVGTDALRGIYYFDEERDAFTHVCSESYDASL